MADNSTELNAEAYLSGFPRFADKAGRAYKPGLERIQRLLDGMGRPQDAFDCIHVAGTNGKGSTASMIAAIGTAAGRRVGLHTSPHLFHVAERMRIDGKPAPSAWLWNAVARYRELAESVKPSYFEFTVALSLLYFAEEDVDIAVVEVGMGGRLDATNVLHPELSVITDVGLDHTDFLGSSIQEVAGEKAGIVKSGVPVVTSACPEAARVIENVARDLGSTYHDALMEVESRDESFGLHGTRWSAETPLRRYEGIFVGLAGKHQLRNARAALRSAEIVYDDVHLHARAVVQGMRRVRELSGLRGRLEVVREDPLIIADVAHNADGIRGAMHYVKSVIRPEGQIHVLLGVMRDKNVEAIARTLSEVGAMVRPITVPSERGLSAEELASQFRVVHPAIGRTCTVKQGVHDFIATAGPQDALLVTGSHLVVAALENVLP